MIRFIKNSKEDINTNIQSVQKCIENETDIEAYNKAFEEYENNPITYTMDEVKYELGI